MNHPADLIPNTWLDPLLTGPDAVLKGSGPWTGTDIENLMRALRLRMETSFVQPEAADSSEAVMIGKQACSAYVEWYANGHSHEAGAIAYDLVSAIRNMLAALRNDAAGDKA